MRYQYIGELPLRVYQDIKIHESNISMICMAYRDKLVSSLFITQTQYVHNTKHAICGSTYTVCIKNIQNNSIKHTNVDYCFVNIMQLYLLFGMTIISCNLLTQCVLKIVTWFKCHATMHTFLCGLNINQYQSLRRCEWYLDRSIKYRIINTIYQKVKWYNRDTKWPIWLYIFPKQ